MRHRPVGGSGSRATASRAAVAGAAVAGLTVAGAAAVAARLAVRQPNHGWLDRHAALLSRSAFRDDVAHTAAVITAVTGASSRFVLHEGRPERAAVVPLLDRLLTGLARRDYRCVTLSELVGPPTR